MSKLSPTQMIAVLESILDGDFSDLAQPINYPPGKSAKSAPIYGQNSFLDPTGAVQSISTLRVTSDVVNTAPHILDRKVNEAVTVSLAFDYDYLYPVPAEAVASSPELMALSRNGKDPVFLSQKLDQYFSRVKAITMVECVVAIKDQPTRTLRAYSFCFFRDEYDRRRGAEEALRRLLKRGNAHPIVREALWKLFIEIFGPSGNPTKNGLSLASSDSVVDSTDWFEDKLSVKYQLADASSCEEEEN